MTQSGKISKFKTKLLRPVLPSDSASWAFVVLPKLASEALPRRGRTTVDVAINGHSFRSTLEPDGQLSHWLKINEEQLKEAKTSFGDVVLFKISPLDEEPEPEVPSDLSDALAANLEAREVWNDTTPIARLDWIHWIVTAKQDKTRAKRINEACDKLSSGKRRVCCFDPSGFYSKALSAPKAEE